VCCMMIAHRKLTINLLLVSALEIITKLTKPDFARKAKAADFFPKAWEVMRNAGAGDGDKVCDMFFNACPELH
jgi:hypothetical protein